MRGHLLAIALLALTTSLVAATDGSWLRNVPQQERARQNPYAENNDAVVAGGILFKTGPEKGSQIRSFGELTRTGSNPEKVLGQLWHGDRCSYKSIKCKAAAVLSLFLAVLPTFRYDLSPIQGSLTVQHRKERRSKHLQIAPAQGSGQLSDVNRQI